MPAATKSEAKVLEMLSTAERGFVEIESIRAKSYSRGRRLYLAAIGLETAGLVEIVQRRETRDGRWTHSYLLVRAANT